MKRLSGAPKSHWAMIMAIVEDEEYFFERWSSRMEEAGYLEHTTAKRLDCMLALNEFLEPMRRHWDKWLSIPGFSGPPATRRIGAALNQPRR